LITLLTDFGSSDYFVAAMKGVILGANPNANLVDITHEIPPQDVQTAAFTLFAAHRSFPAGTIHLAVVDPGVGSKRRALLIEASEQYFVGPDNGIFSYVWEQAKPRVFHLNKPEYFRHPISETFNGRDVFAPVAAALSLGVKPAKLGSAVNEYVQLPSLKAETGSDGSIHGRIITVDHFGNCVTNITPKELTEKMIAGGARLLLRKHSITSFHRFFAEAGNSSQPFAVWGSANFLEIAVRNRSAARLLEVKTGDSIVIMKA
jgi:S-adenosylmethionine hydrolase